MKLRSVTSRLTAIYVIAFATAVAVLGVAILLSMRGVLMVQFENRIQAESEALVREFVTEGYGGLVSAVQERDRTPGALDYGLESQTGQAMAGHLVGIKAPIGWSTQSVRGANGETELERVWTVALPSGHHLTVGDDLDRIQVLDGLVFWGFSAAFGGIIVFGAGGGYLLSRGVRRRFAAVISAAEAVSEGQLSQRALVRDTVTDDLDQLGVSFNRMLDRISALLESLRQVTNDVAHDLRTPLTRLKRRLDGALKTADVEAKNAAIEDGLGDLETILETFAALLRIAQIEGGQRRAGFRSVDLLDLAQLVVDTFEPSAEEGGRSLSLAASESAIIDGDAELITQMLVNLVENGLRHTQVGARIVVTVETTPPAITVTDNGPGVPATELGRVMDRFYRLERSRTTPGDGLGLSLVGAVAKLHDAEVSLADAAPGLAVRVAFRTP